MPPPPEKSRCAQRHRRNAIGAPARSGGGGGEPRGPEPRARRPQRAHPNRLPGAARAARLRRRRGAARSRDTSAAARPEREAGSQPTTCGRRAPLSRRFVRPVRPGPGQGHAGGFSENVRSVPHRFTKGASERLFLSPPPLGDGLGIAHLFPSRPAQRGPAGFCSAAV